MSNPIGMICRYDLSVRMREVNSDWPCIGMSILVLAMEFAASQIH